jgi:NAD(P)-dependent dehydrogenase (short-subunit alcohol dehydrogenase family)
VNSAGVLIPGNVESMDPADLERMMGVNLYGTVHAMQAVLPSMRARWLSGRAKLSIIGAVLGDVYPALISRSGEVRASKSVCLLCMSRMRAAVCSSARLLLGSPPPFDRRRSGPTSESAAERACLRIA